MIRQLQEGIQGPRSADRGSGGCTGAQEGRPGRRRADGSRRADRGIGGRTEAEGGHRYRRENRDV